MLLGGFLLYSSGGSAQSGWTKPKGELFSRIGYQYFSSDQYYNLAGNKIQTSQYKQHTISLYGEYGLTDRLTILLDWPVFKSHRFETSESVEGWGDIKAGLKYAIAKKIPVSFSIIPEIPIARANRYASNLSNPDFNINLPTGDGEFNVFNVLAISASLYPLPIYFNLFAAYNLRTKYENLKLSDQMLYGLELGGKVFDIAWLKGAIKMQNTPSTGTTEVSFVRGEGTEYSSLNLGVYVPVFSGWGIDVNYFDYIRLIQKRKNIYDAPTFSIGLVYEIKGKEESP